MQTYLFLFLMKFPPMERKRKERQKKKIDSIYTIASFVAAISRASTSGVKRANAFFVPSGLIPAQFPAR